MVHSCAHSEHSFAPHVYCDHWCVSKAQLDRYVRMIKAGIRDISKRESGTVKGDAPMGKKRDHVVIWCLQYASEVTENLPNSDEVPLPRMKLWADLHKLFMSDMEAAGYGAAEICQRDYFRRTFNRATELSGMEMTTYKRNFEKCSECVVLTAAATAAIKGHDAKEAAEAKDKRLAHNMLARSDKLHYWHNAGR